MKLLKTSEKDGYAKIRIDNIDDLWHLKDIFTSGAKVRALTQRTKIDGREKKTLTLTLEVEKVEYQNDRLRVTGEMTQADDQVEQGYHTFNFEPEDEFEIWKDFSQSEWQDLREAESKDSYKVLFVLVEKGAADLYLVRESGISDLSKLQQNIPGKLYEKQDTGEGFHRELVNVIERSAADVDHVVLGGPGFEKEHVYDDLKDNVKSKTLVQDTSVTGETGLNEAIKRGALRKLVQNSRIADETALLEEVFEELRKDGKVEYGEPVRNLAEQGAVEKLVITEEEFRENQELVKTVEQNGGEVQKIHTDHEAGMRLENFGGIAAILRYKPQ